MAGHAPNPPIPEEIKLHQQSRCLELTYEGSPPYTLSCEFLRVFTPSAEARGHAPGQETLQTGKRNVNIERIEPVGTYALRFVFTDGHDSGLYSWDMLHNFCLHQAELWETYLNLLETQGLSRDIDTTSRPAPGGSCGHHH